MNIDTLKAEFYNQLNRLLEQQNFCKLGKFKLIPKVGNDVK